jgi:Trypsin Inhibitor like cysteine rich domain
LIRSAITKKCITNKKCQQILTESNTASLCGENEVFSKTETNCQPSCHTRKSNENKKCKASGCICKEGFVRDVKYGECIAISKCPSNLIKVFIELELDFYIFQIADPVKFGNPATTVPLLNVIIHVELVFADKDILLTMDIA